MRVLIRTRRNQPVFSWYFTVLFVRAEKGLTFESAIVKIFTPGDKGL